MEEEIYGGGIGWEINFFSESICHNKYICMSTMDAWSLPHSSFFLPSQTLLGYRLKGSKFQKVVNRVTRVMVYVVIFVLFFFSLGMKKDEKGATKTNKDHNVCLIVEVIDVRSTPVYLLPCRNDRWRHPWKLLCVLLERLFLFIVDLNIIIAKSSTVEIRVHWWSATSFFQPGSQFVSRFTFLIPRSKIVLNCSVAREEKKEEHAWVIKSILLLKGQKTNWFRISEPSANSNR